MLPLKAEIVKTGHYRILALPFGGPKKGSDYDGERFTPRTDPKPDWFPERPVLFHHGGDPFVKDDLIGREGDIEKEKDGWWGDVWLDRSHRYFAQMERLIDRGAMFGSSGSLAHLVQKASDGEILVWPHVEQTLSPIARNPYSVLRATKALSDYSESGIQLSAATAGLLQQLEDLSTNLHSDLRRGEDAAQATLHRALDELEAVLRRI